MPRHIVVVSVCMAILLGVACNNSEPETISITVPVTRIVTQDVIVETEPIEVTRLVTPIPGSTPEPIPVSGERPTKELVICMAQEPTSLYWYGTETFAAQVVWHAIFENDYTSLSYAYQPQGLVTLPSLENGEAIINTVTATEGDLVLSADGNVVTLTEGIVVINAAGETTTYEGNPIEMQQMVVSFTMQPRIWADGTPVTATDSVYSFQLAADPNTPVNKFLIDRTASYEVTGDLTIQWTGIAGYLAATYFVNFWKPLPQHQWQALTAADLVTAEMSSRMPLGDGPFVIESWLEGEAIQLVRNENYYRVEEGLPHLDHVTLRFMPDANQILAQLLTGECDIVTQDSLDVSFSPFLIEAESNGLLLPYFETGTVFENIAFGINSYGEYGDDVGRPDWFEDVRVRQAMMMCTNRQEMINAVAFGQATIMNSFVPEIHPLYAVDVPTWSYDVAAANLLLDEVGFRDRDGDGIREYAGSGTEQDGTPFRVTLWVESNNTPRAQIAQIFQQSMQQCGIEVRINYTSAPTLYADGPLGPLFGRQFDLVQFAWLTDVKPACELFLSDNITGPEEEFFGGWTNLNATGWSTERYDIACRTALSSLPGTPPYETAFIQTQQIFYEQLPIIPLFSRLKVAATSPHVTGFNLDPTQDSELWNLFELDIIE